MPKLHARLNDGTPVDVEMKDMGEQSARDANGQPYRAAATYVVVGDRYVISYTDVDLMKQMKKKERAGFRLAEDRAALEALDVDIDSLYWASEAPDVP